MQRWAAALLLYSLIPWPEFDRHLLLQLTFTAQRRFTSISRRGDIDLCQKRVGFAFAIDEELDYASDVLGGRDTRRAEREGMEADIIRRRRRRRRHKHKRRHFRRRRKKSRLRSAIERREKRKRHHKRKKEAGDSKNLKKSAPTWEYRGEKSNPETWYHEYSQCDPELPGQSPISIYTDIVSYDPSLTPIKLTNWHVPLSHFTLSNVGTTMKLIPPPLEASIAGGGFPIGQHKILSVHFHWGKYDHQGSEHVVNGKSFPMEMHIIVHNEQKLKFRRRKVRSEKRTPQIGVIAFLFDIMPEDKPDNNITIPVKPTTEKPKIGRFRRLIRRSKGGTRASVDGFAHLTKLLSKITQPDQVHVFRNTGLRLCDLVNRRQGQKPGAPFPCDVADGPYNFGQFFHYIGSLTAPPCSPNIEWTVFREPLLISKAELERFRMLSDRNGYSIGDNFRGPLPVGDRIVFTNVVRNPHGNIKNGQDDSLPKQYDLDDMDSLTSRRTGLDTASIDEQTPETLSVNEQPEEMQDDY